MEPNPANPSTFFADVSNFVVIGLYESGMFAYDNAFGFISLEIAQDLYNQKNHINLIQVRTTTPEIASTVANRIRREIQFSNAGLYSVPRTSTWVESHAALFEAIQLEKLVTVIIEALIILVASFNIASTLIMMVMEKTREIGILRSMGSSKMKILIIFVLQGCIIGFLGIVLGSALGIGTCFLLALEVVRPSRWFALLIFVPIFLQVAIALHRTIRRSRSLKFAISLLWLGIMAFVLYCLVQPIQINSEVYQLNRLAVKIDWFFVGVINFSSFFICLLATLYPAWQASKLNPVEALRYE
jgi:lipoprotein-releasing system permease protein